uniref:Uncharacterized protein n=1 Tax=viral metagenome TaxID=1070528 RepID=A0A6C0LUE0_9ZZZZ
MFDITMLIPVPIIFLSIFTCELCIDRACCPEKKTVIRVPIDERTRLTPIPEE